MNESNLITRFLGKQDYQPCWQAMQHFTNTRDENTPDEIWILEHFPVFTQGQNGKAEHLLNPGDIPVINVDRGGQITYHGPGQLVIYPLINLKRRKLTIRDIVTILEQSTIDLLEKYQVHASAKKEAPGVYINDKKICSIGLRVRRNCTFHGLAFNVAMDLEPFSRINPCGFKGLTMTQLSDYVSNIQWKTLEQEFVQSLMKNLGYTTATREVA